MPKRRRCRDCGYLSKYPYSAKDPLAANMELTLRERRELDTDSYLGTGTGFSCFRVGDAWMQSDQAKVMRWHQCPHFFRHNPGSTPLEHRELQKEAQKRRVKIISIIVSATIGIVGIIVGIIIKFAYL